MGRTTTRRRRFPSIRSHTYETSIVSLATPGWGVSRVSPALVVLKRAHELLLRELQRARRLEWISAFSARPPASSLLNAAGVRLCRSSRRTSPLSAAFSFRISALPPRVPRLRRHVAIRSTSSSARLSRTSRAFCSCSAALFALETRSASRRASASSRPSRPPWLPRWPPRRSSTALCAAFAAFAAANFSVEVCSPSRSFRRAWTSRSSRACAASSPGARGCAPWRGGRSCPPRGRARARRQRGRPRERGQRWECRGTGARMRRGRSRRGERLGGLDAGPRVAPSSSTEAFSSSSSKEAWSGVGGVFPPPRHSTPPPRARTPPRSVAREGVGRGQGLRRARRVGRMRVD